LLFFVDQISLKEIYNCLQKPQKNKTDKEMKINGKSGKENKVGKRL
jgi:hypothetical protein